MMNISTPNPVTGPFRWATPAARTGTGEPLQRLEPSHRWDVFFVFITNPTNTHSSETSALQFIDFKTVWRLLHHGPTFSREVIVSFILQDRISCTVCSSGSYLLNTQQTSHHRYRKRTKQGWKSRYRTGCRCLRSRVPLLLSRTRMDQTLSKVLCPFLVEGVGQARFPRISVMTRQSTRYQVSTVDKDLDQSTN